MLRYVTRRILELVFTLLCISILVFSIIHVMPGDPALLAAGLEASPEVVEGLRKELGLDQPLPTQFGRFLLSALSGDLGVSIRTRSPVASEILERFPRTLTIAVAAALAATVLGMLSGIVSAVHRNGLSDRLLTGLALALVSTPSYWLGLMLMLVFSLALGLLPSIGIATPLHYVLPVVTLAASSSGMIARMTRQALLDALSRPYVGAALARGLGRRRALLRHALRNALLPILSLVGLRFSNLLAGAVIVESVFAVPGLGRLMVDAVVTRDFPLIQGTLLAVGAIFVFINATTDLLYGVIDPRVRVA